MPGPSSCTSRQVDLVAARRTSTPPAGRAVPGGVVVRLASNGPAGPGPRDREVGGRTHNAPAPGGGGGRASATAASSRSAAGDRSEVQGSAPASRRARSRRSATSALSRSDWRAPRAARVVGGTTPSTTFSSAGAGRPGECAARGTRWPPARGAPVGGAEVGGHQVERAGSAPDLVAARGRDPLAVVTRRPSPPAARVISRSGEVIPRASSWVTARAAATVTGTLIHHGTCGCVADGGHERGHHHAHADQEPQLDLDR